MNRRIRHGIWVVLRNALMVCGWALLWWARQTAEIPDLQFAAIIASATMLVAGTAIIALKG